MSGWSLDSKAAKSSVETGVTEMSGFLPFKTLERNGSGQPPGRSPNSPAMKPITESGMS